MGKDPKGVFAEGCWRALMAISQATMFERLLTQKFYKDLLVEQIEHAGFAPGSSLLEIGCGPGALGALTTPGTFELTGFDASSAMLRRAGQRAGKPYSRLIQGRVPELPFPDASFDGAFCASLIHLVAAPDVVLQQIERVLRPGATLLIAGPEPGFTPQAIEHLSQTYKLGAFERGAIRLWSSTKKRLGSDELQKLMNTTGFESLDTIQHLGKTMFSLRATLAK